MPLSDKNSAVEGVISDVAPISFGPSLGGRLHSARALPRSADGGDGVTVEATA